MKPYAWFIIGGLAASVVWMFVVTWLRSTTGHPCRQPRGLEGGHERRPGEATPTCGAPAHGPREDYHHPGTGAVPLPHRLPAYLPRPEGCAHGLAASGVGRPVSTHPKAPATCQGPGVLEPFCGAGTICRVATRLNRRAIGVDLNLSYLRLATRRLTNIQRSVIGVAS